MNKLNVNILASSSAGNCIVVDDGTSKIMLDAGLPYRKIAKKVKVSEMEAVLITHQHGDHVKAVHELVRRGIDVYASRDVRNYLDLPWAITEHRLVQSGLQVETGNWFIMPFYVEHDAPCLGYLIESKNTGGKGLYFVDTARIEFDFTGVTHWIVEANYAKEILDKSKYEDFLKDRVEANHMSIENLLRFLGSSDLSAAEEIYLVHLSRANANEQRFIKEVQQATGVPVFTGHEYQESFVPKSLLNEPT